MVFMIGFKAICVHHTPSVILLCRYSYECIPRILYFDFGFFQHIYALCLFSASFNFSSFQFILFFHLSNIATTPIVLHDMICNANVFYHIHLANATVYLDAVAFVDFSIYTFYKFLFGFSPHIDPI